MHQHIVQRLTERIGQRYIIILRRCIQPPAHHLLQQPCVGMPAAVFADVGRNALRAPRGADRDLLAGRGLAPELRFGLLLEHHVVAENAGQDDFRLHREGCAERGQCEKDSFHR
mgnify:CR=1 FL=1